MKVVSINESKIESSKHTLELLERAIETVKELGSLNCAIVIYTVSGMIFNDRANNNNPYLMIGAIEELKRDFSDDCIEREK